MKIGETHTDNQEFGDSGRRHPAQKPDHALTQRTLTPHKARLFVGGGILSLLLLIGGAQYLLNPPPQQKGLPAPDIFNVRVRTIIPQLKRVTLMVTGRTIASKDVLIKGEAKGKVIEVIREKGDFIKKGQPLIRLADNDRPVRLEQANSLLKMRALEYEAAQKLAKRTYYSQLQLQEAANKLAQAKAQLAAIELEIENTTVSSPIDGLVEDRMVEVGDYILDPMAGSTEVARILCLNPLKIIAYLPEKDHTSLQKGSLASVRLLDGSEHTARLVYISQAATEKMRTFRVEFDLPNPSLSIPSGITADVTIPTTESLAYPIPPSILTLDDKGILGVKIVNEEGQVAFVPVEIVSHEPSLLWISGLSGSVRFITVGHEFVVVGEKVAAVEEQLSSNASQKEGL